MNLKKIVVFFVLSILFISTGFVFAEDLVIDGGKDYKIDFRGGTISCPNYNGTVIYENVNIGNATKVVLGSEMEYSFISSKQSTSPYIVDAGTPGANPGDTDYIRYKVYVTTNTYRKDEVLATLAISQNGQITINSGSELSIRNQYSLITSTQDVAVSYIEDSEGNINTTGYLVNKDDVNEYESIDSNGKPKTYKNKKIKEETLNLFKGDIVFAEGDSDTVLTFRKLSSKNSEDYALPIAKPDRIQEEEERIFRKDQDIIVESPSDIPEEDKDITTMVNNFRIDSTRAVFNVESGKSGSAEWNETEGSVTLIAEDFGQTSYITGKGCLVKTGEGILNLGYKKDSETGQIKQVNAMGLTGEFNNGFGWSIEEGRLNVHNQVNLGTSSVSISGGCLAITNRNGSFSNKIKFVGNKGDLQLSQNSNVTLSGEITTDLEKGGIATFDLYNYSVLNLTGNNSAKEFNINYGGKEGGEENYVITNIAGLATDIVRGTNRTADDLKEFASLELVLNVDENDKIKEYNGSFQEDLFLRKIGTGVITLFGESSQIGTYITEGGILLANSNALGTGKIMFDGGVKGDTTTYASIGVSSMTTGVINLSNNIHVSTGAIFNVAEGQQMYLMGDLVNSKPEYETNFIKNGLGELVIAEITDKQRNVNITSFTITDGGFVLDKNVILDSYFSLDGQQAYLKMSEKSGINNKIDIKNGDLIVFNEFNLSFADEINFLNTSSSTESFSKLHITSDTVLSNETISGNINILKNIEFVTDATTTVNLGKFNFESGENTKIVKSGEGKFIVDNNSNNFNIDSLYINDGDFRLENINMNVSSVTLVNGGILSVSSTSHFASTADSPEIKVLSGGIGIYDDNSIDGNTVLNFEGTDEANLSKLIIESEGVELTNDINVKAGINIQNEKDLIFSGNQINFDRHYAGILAKSGAGTMTIKTTDIFQMGELKALEGNLLVKSNISVSTISVLGKNALLSFENVENAEIKNALYLSEGGTLAVSTSTLNIDNIALDSATITNTSSNINITKGLTINNSKLSLFENNAKISAGEDISFSSSIVTLAGTNANIKATNDIGFIDSTLTLSATSAQISASNDISFESSKINLSSNSTSINAVNNIYFVNSEIDLSTSADITAKTINLDSSTLVFSDPATINNAVSNAVNLNPASVNFASINATTFNLSNGSSLTAFGEVLSDINVGKKSYIKIGKDTSIDTLQTKNVVFESDSSLYIDVNSVSGVKTNDKLEVNGDITVHKDATLYVNLMGEESEYESSKEFEFLTFSGNYTFDNTTNEIFDIVLSNARFSASTALIEKSIFLKIAQEWSVYDIPGATKNQEAMIDVFNKIYADETTKESMKSVLSTLDAIYSSYRITGNKTQFINALQDLSGIFYANSFMTSAMLSKANIIYSRLNNFSVEVEKNNKVWAQVYTNNFSVAENEENPKFENNMYGMIAGYDTVNDEDLVFGIAGFYGQGELKQLDDKADVIDAGVNVYGDYKINENIDIKGLIGYSMQDYDTTRTLRFIKQEIKSKYATNTISLDLEAAYRYDLNEKLSLKPLVGANCAIVSNGDIEEDGDTEQKLKIDKNSYTKADVRVGVGLQSRAVSPFNWYVSAAVKQIVVGDKFTTKSYFVKASDYEFEIESTKLASTSFVGNLGCSYDINSSFNVSLDLNADTGSASGFGGNIGATYRW